MKRRLFAVVIAFIMLFASFASASGFIQDVAGMNKAAKSVFKLIAYVNGEAYATGSGFVAYTNNLLVTNYHVIEGADRIVAVSDDGDEYTVTQVLTADKTWDYAILVFPAGGIPLALAADDPMRGAPCVAIGSPRGMQNTFSAGMISGTYTDPETDIKYIQFNAPISSGSSGGALFNDDGEVIGITSWTIRDNNSSSATQNMNYAIDIRDITEIYQKHRSDTPVDLADSFRIADPTYKDSWQVGETITLYGKVKSDLGIQIPRDFEVFSYNDSIFMTRGTTRVRVVIYDAENMGLVGMGLSFLGQFVNLTNQALLLFAGQDFGKDFRESDLSHPRIAGGFDCAVTPVFTAEYEGMDKNVAIGVVSADSTYMELIASSPNGSASELESVLRAAMDCVVAVDPE